HYYYLEPERAAAFWLHRRGSHRQTGYHTDSGGSAERGTRDPGAIAAWRAYRPLRNHPTPQGWHTRSHFAHRLTCPRRFRARDRRVKSCARHYGNSKSPRYTRQVPRGTGTARE